DPGVPKKLTSRTAGWLVPELSLLSKKTNVAEGFATIKNPLLGEPFSHAFTWLVTSRTRYVLAVFTGTLGATRGPVEGAFKPVTVNSLQAEPAALISTEPGAPMRVTNNLRVAMEI